MSRDGRRKNSLINMSVDDERYEYRVLTLARGVSRGEARQLLTEHAEYGRWELARVALYMGGTRKVWLRRRILRVQRSF
jgi:hypothetical protein